MTAAYQQQNDAETITDVKSSRLLYVQTVRCAAAGLLHSLTLT